MKEAVGHGFVVGEDEDEVYDGDEGADKAYDGGEGGADEGDELRYLLFDELVDVLEGEGMGELVDVDVLFDEVLYLG